MTPTEFRAARRTLQLSTEALAEQLHVDPRTVRRWQEGSQPVPGPVAVAMALLLRHAPPDRHARHDDETG